jgi:uncharacterized protein (DUF1810 family)
MLGGIDAQKFRSCLTLFIAAADDAPTQQVLKQALDSYYGGVPDPRTLALLGKV